MGSEALHMQVEHAVGYYLDNDEAAVKHQQDHELRDWNHSHQATEADALAYGYETPASDVAGNL